MAATSPGGASGAPAKKKCPCPCPCAEKRATVQAGGTRVVADAATAGAFAGSPFRLPTYDDWEMLTLGDRGSVVLSGPDFTFRDRKGGGFFAASSPAVATATGKAGVQARPTGDGRTAGPVGQIALPKQTEEQRRRMDVEAKMRPAPSVKQADPTASSFESAQAAMRATFSGASPVDQRRGDVETMQKKMQEDLAKSGIRLGEHGPSAGGREPSPDREAAAALASPPDPTAKDFKTTAKFESRVGRGAGAALEEMTRFKEQSRKQGAGGPTSALTDRNGLPTARASDGSGGPVAPTVSAMPLSTLSRATGSSSTTAGASGPRGAISSNDRRAIASARRSESVMPSGATSTSAAGSARSLDDVAGSVAAHVTVSSPAPPAAPVSPSPVSASVVRADVEEREEFVDLTSVGASVMPDVSASHSVAPSASSTPRDLRDPVTGETVSSFQAQSIPTPAAGRLPPGNAVFTASQAASPFEMTGTVLPAQDLGATETGDVGADEVTQFGPPGFAASDFEGGVEGAGGRTARPSVFASAAADVKWEARRSNDAEWWRSAGDDARASAASDSAAAFWRRAIAKVARAWNATRNRILGDSPTTGKDLPAAQREAIERARQGALTDLARAIRDSRLSAWKAGGKKGRKPSKADALGDAEALLSEAEDFVQEDPPYPTPPPVGGAGGKGGRAPAPVVVAASSARSGLPIPHGIAATEPECECPCPCDGEGGSGGGGEGGGGGGEQPEGGGDDEDDEPGVRGSGEVTENPLNVDPIVGTDADAPRTKSERLKLLETQRRLKREEKKFIGDSIRALRKLFREKGIRKVPSFSAWLRDAHIRELLSAKFNAQLARRVTAGRIERALQYIAGGVPGFSARDVEYYNLRVGETFLSEALIDFELKMAAGLATAVDAILLVEAAQQLDAWTVEFHAGADGADAAPGLGAVWTHAVSRNGPLVEMLAAAEPTVQQAVMKATSAVSWWDAPSLLSTPRFAFRGLSLAGGAILEHVAGLRDAPRVRQDAGLDERRLRDRLVGAMGAIGEAQRERVIEGAEALVAKQFEGMEPWEIGAYTAGALLIGVATGALAAGGYALAAGSTLKIIAVSAAVGALGAAAEESLWQSFKHDSLNPSNWDEGAVGTAALFGGAAGGVLGPFAAKGMGITAKTFRGGVRQYADDLAASIGSAWRGTKAAVSVQPMEGAAARLGAGGASRGPLPVREFPWAEDQTGRLIREGSLGETTFRGRVTIQPGLDPVTKAETLRHEFAHRWLTPLGDDATTVLRQDVRGWFYNRSQIMKGLEEAVAETYGTRNLARGVAFPFTHGYVTPTGWGVGDLIVVAGAGGTTYLVKKALDQ